MEPKAKSKAKAKAKGKAKAKAKAKAKPEAEAMVEDEPVAEPEGSEAPQPKAKAAAKATAKATAKAKAKAKAQARGSKGQPAVDADVEDCEDLEEEAMEVDEEVAPDASAGRVRKPAVIELTESEVSEKPVDLEPPPKRTRGLATFTEDPDTPKEPAPPEAA